MQAIKDYGALFENYRTIAFEALNTAGFADPVRDNDPTYATLLPSDLNAKILDVGCGMGHFLKFLELKGYKNLYGVEISPEQVECCKANVTAHVVLTDSVIDHLMQQSQQWDCIVFKDVIEHVARAEVIPTLSAIFHSLRPGGLLLVETGNMASLTGTYLRHIDFTHESGFTEGSLRQVLRAVGFENVKVLPNKRPMHSWKSYALRLFQNLMHATLRFAYQLDRGWGAAPTIMSNLIIAVGLKPSTKGAEAL
jgi:2-polyprenyl-3-methyl-5-hydroxy-6-metoxy-1,4-benzoquinol methylase